MKAQKLLKTNKLLRVMVFTLLTFNFQFLTFNSYAQGIAINTSGAAPNNSAMLDVSGTSQGVLINRMTTSQRTAINSPALGLLIFNTDCENFNYYTNSGWLSLNPAITGFPEAAGAITGTSPACLNQNGAAYSVSAVSGATNYLWSYSGTGFTCASGCNTNSITVNFSGAATSGTLTVTPSNACGNGTVQTLMISVNAFPTTASAGSDQNLACGSTTTTLAGNTPVVGTGNWTVVSGTATITTPGSPISGVTGLAVPGTATLRWTISNSPCTASTDDVIINSASGTPTVTDYDNNTYNSISIGTQCWMKENLKTTHYNNGSSILYISDNSTWASNTTGARSYYNNTDTATYKATYGGLYNGYAAIKTNICPTGWHVPTDAEWTTFTTYLGGVSGAGGKLKETGTTHWSSPNTGATNETGYTALSSGNRNSDGTYASLGEIGYWWSRTYAGSYAYQRSVTYNNSDVGRYNSRMANGLSVRCLKD
ncbi:MAG: hypothetical protein HGB12_06050 [Bacteroidetes bacterium]|nr:hypothetical protein [Bacteroidota bacterium]